MDKYEEEVKTFAQVADNDPSANLEFPKKQGYLLSFWGALTKNPEFKKIHGDKKEGHDEYNRWFDTREERDSFKTDLFKLEVSLGVRGLATSADEGAHTHWRTVGIATVREQDGKEYAIERDYGYGYPSHTVLFDFEENNCSCCHRRRDMVIEQYPDCGLGKLDDCDAEPPIVIIKFAIEYRP